MQNSDNYKIVYSNHFEFNGRILAFRKGFLFDIGGMFPQYLPTKEDNGCKGWYITHNSHRSWLGKEKAKQLAEKMIPKEVDITNLEWYVQEELKECFNLEGYCKSGKK